MKKKYVIIIGTVLLLGCFSIYLILGGINDIKQIQTKSTDLSNEKINNFGLMDKSINIRTEYNLQKPDVQNEKEDGWIGYNYGSNSYAYIRTDLKDQTIIFSSTLKKFHTNRHIGIDTDIKKIEKAYGKNNYKITNDQGLYVIGYIDRVHEIRLEFYYVDKSVQEISISKLRSVNGDRKWFGKWI